MSDDYEIGYKKPPLNTQFKKGKSGNPKGRSKGSKSTHEILKDIFMEPVNIRENRSCKRVTKIEALLMSVVNKALSGDKHACREVFKFLPKIDALMKTDDTQKIEVVFVNAPAGSMAHDRIDQK